MDRYNRHKPLYNEEEFAAIRNATIAVAGCGGLGSTVLQLLARLGVGTIHFWDDAILDPPDLNRQILYNTTHLGKTKTEVAFAELKKINPDIELIPHFERLIINANIPKVDLAIDCLDSIASRLTLDHLFFEKGIPIIHGSVFREMGQLTTLFPGKTDNYQITFGVEDALEESTEKTIFPAIVSTIASLQVTEAIKCITKRYDLMLINKLLLVNLRKNQFETLPLR